MTKKIITRYASFFFGVLFIALNLISIKVEASSTQIRGRSTVAQTVYTGPSSSNYEVMGSIDANEEIYILGKEKGLNWYHIQYHAGSKQKSGYSWGTAGSVDAGEYVAVLAGSAGRNIVYVEYNTSSGRKRGYMPASKLAFHGGVTVASLDDMYGIPGGTEVGAYPLAPVSGKTAVYAGPGTSYAKVGYIMPETTYGFDGEINS